MNQLDPGRFPAGPAVLRVVDGHQAVLEQAKGALMLRFRIGSYPAFALLVKWAHEYGTSPQTVAHTLVRGLCQGERLTGTLERSLLAQIEHELEEVP